MQEPSVAGASLGLSGQGKLNPGEVVVWSYSLDVAPSMRDRYRSWLSDDEVGRASRFVAARDQERFVVAHGALRAIVGGYLGKSPGALRFRKGPSGKPELEECDARPSVVSFNLTHSHGRGVVAVAADRRVGVDLEFVRQDVEYLKLARRFFSAAEQHAIMSQDRSDQAMTFFRHWVAKEAYLKLKGVGLQFPLDRCQVTVSSEQSSAAVEWSLNLDSPEQGIVRFLDLPDGWIGAVAAEGSGWTVRLEEWPGASFQSVSG